MIEFLFQTSPIFLIITKKRFEVFSDTSLFLEILFKLCDSISGTERSKMTVSKTFGNRYAYHFSSDTFALLTESSSKYCVNY